MKERVRVTARSLVEAYVEVDGETAEQREDKAIQCAREGNVEWLYNGVEDSTIAAG
jgi:hypothetical protein